MLAASVAALLQLAARRDSLARDIIFLGTADEESGGGGITRLIERDFDLIKDVEFALNEGGRVAVAGGRVRAINIQVAEKVSYEVEARATGPSGHGSVPLPGNALAALSRALARVHEWKAPVRLNDVTRAYFGRLATIEEDPAMRRAMETLATARDDKQVMAAAEILSRETTHNAVLRTGVSLTMLRAGIRVNIIPSDATATLNVREMPDGDIQATVGRTQPRRRRTAGGVFAESQGAGVSACLTARFRDVQGDGSRGKRDGVRRRRHPVHVDGRHRRLEASRAGDTHLRHPSAAAAEGRRVADARR